MEDEDSKVAVKPDRTPDYVTTYGSAYWWQEMVYVGATGEVGRIIWCNSESTNESHGERYI